MSKSEAGIYIDGKKQAIELLQSLTEKERERILYHIRAKNASMADELSVKCIKFSQIQDLKDFEVHKLCDYVHPTILGVALRGVSVSVQKSILSACGRSFAEQAYTAMTAQLSDTEKKIRKAQQKILDALVNLSRKGLIESL